MAVNLNRVTQQQVPEATQMLPAPRFLITSFQCVYVLAGWDRHPPTHSSHAQWRLHTQMAVQGHTPSYLLLHVHGLEDFKD